MKLIKLLNLILWNLEMKIWKWKNEHIVEKILEVEVEIENKIKSLQAEENTRQVAMRVVDIVISNLMIWE